MIKAVKYDYWEDSLKILLCKTDKIMAEEEESDAIGLNIALEFSKNLEKNFLTIQKKMNLSPPHMGP